MPYALHEKLRSMEGLASLRWPKDSDRIVALKQKLREMDPPYFVLYMNWVRRRQSPEQAITNPHYVYSDD